MEPAVAVFLIPIVAIICATAIKLAKLKSGESSPAAGALEGRLQALEDELTRVRGELSEMQERIDFTERLLAQSKESRRLE
jgi:hypothetical protein